MNLHCWSLQCRSSFISTASRYFWINKFNVPSLRGRIPPDMLFVSSFNAPLTFPFCIRVLNCYEIAAMSPDLCVDFSWDWISFAWFLMFLKHIRPARSTRKDSFVRIHVITCLNLLSVFKAIFKQYACEKLNIDYLRLRLYKITMEFSTFMMR